MPALRASSLHDLSYVAEKGDNLAVSLAIARLKGNMAAVRGAALEVLETLALKGDERAVEAVVAACGDNADAIRINAARVHLELTQQLFTESAGIADGPDNAAAAARNAAPPRASGTASTPLHHLSNTTANLSLAKNEMSLGFEIFDHLAAAGEFDITHKRL